MSKINSVMLKKMFINGAEQIAQNFAYINELNVFPIPDGDTGTNMKITSTAAANELSLIETTDLSIIGKGFSKALLMNARGNSGVILSQIMKGFVSNFKEGQKELSTEDLLKSFQSAKEVAYKAVANPVEGTILTVIRCTSERLNQINEDEPFTSTEKLFEAAVREAKTALDNTPNLLEELKRVGVVDSGGYGLYVFIVGMYEALSMKSEKIIEKTKALAGDELKQKISMQFDDHDNEGGFGYCSEIIMKIGARIDPSEKTKKKEFNFQKFRETLLTMGNSLVCVQDDDLVKVHVHTFKPGEFLNYAQQFGEFLKVKFENMTQQYLERMGYQGIDVVDKSKAKEKQIVLEDKTELVLTCPSAKIKKILADEYDIKHVINTEKIGNPSIQDILKEVQKTKANKCIVVTDDSNIVLAANQAKDMVRDQIDMRVIKGNNVFQALIASLDFNPSVSLDANEKAMNKAVANSLSAMVSKAVKDVDYSHISIKKDDYIGIIDKRIEVSDVDELMVLKACVDKLMEKADSPDILMMYYASKTSKKVLTELETYVTKKYELICNFQEGGQKVYSYLLGIQ